MCDSPQPTYMVSSLSMYSYEPFKNYANKFNHCEMDCVKFNVSTNPLQTQYCIDLCK